MVATLLDSFERVEQAIRAKVDRRKNPHNPQSNFSDGRSKEMTPKANFTNKDKRSGGVGKYKKHYNKNSRSECKYCKKFGHWEKDCIIKKGDLARGRKSRF